MVNTTRLPKLISLTLVFPRNDYRTTSAATGVQGFPVVKSKTKASSMIPFQAKIH